MAQRKSDVLGVAADFGNSRLKLRIDSSYHTFDYKEGWSAKVKDIILSRGVPPLIVYSSVNNNALKELRGSIHEKASFLSAVQLLYHYSEMKHKQIKGIGNDRVMGLYGATLRTPPPLITVDCGTAVTVNALDGNMRCVGGAIFAGHRSQMIALAGNTENLREVGFSKIRKSAGKNTKDALNAGILISISSGIEMIVHRIMNEEFGGLEVPVFITGGGASLIRKLLIERRFNFVYRPHLVLEGVWKILKIYVSDTVGK
jgi:pantothenate kinase type III